MICFHYFQRPLGFRLQRGEFDISTGLPSLFIVVGNFEAPLHGFADYTLTIKVALEFIGCSTNLQLNRPDFHRISRPHWRYSTYRLHLSYNPLLVYLCNSLSDYSDSSERCCAHRKAGSLSGLPYAGFTQKPSLKVMIDKAQPRKATILYV